jgi:hypothetical protein
MDVREMQLADGSVDVAIDKSTLDGMLYGSIWNPPADVQTNVGKYVDEVSYMPHKSAMLLTTYRLRAY